MFRHSTPTSASSIKDSGMTRSTKDWGTKVLKKSTEFGLTSKGDTRLTEYKNQEVFFRQIQQRYIFHCGSFPTVPALDEQFTALSITANHPPSSPVRTAAKAVDTTILESILMDMRKLREGLISSARIDDFSTGVYIFITRAAILMSHPESYFPSLRYLLYTIHAVRPLSKPDVNEFAAYLMLHFACSTQSYHDAFEVKNKFQLRDFRAEAVVRSLISGNYWLFWNTEKLVDGYKARIIERAESMMRMQALKVVGRGYMKVDVGYLENITGREWDMLKEEFKIGWEKEGETIHIKKVKERAKPIVKDAQAENPPDATRKAAALAASLGR